MSRQPGPIGGQESFYPESVRAKLPHIVSGRGVWLRDSAGREYMDVASGAFLANLGQGNERVLQAMGAQGRELTYSYVRNTWHTANARLVQKLVDAVGEPFTHAHISSGGSEAVENAIKFLRALALGRGETERTRVITMMPSYHGSSIATAAWTGDRAAPRQYEGLAVFSEKIPAPLTCRAESPAAAAAASLRALRDVLDRVSPDRVLAVLVEPIGGQSSGVNVPDATFLPEVRRLCTDNRIWLVYDEIVSAFRTGTFLAAHHDRSAMPDVVVLGKGLGSGYAPVGAALVPGALVEEVRGYGGFTASQSLDANPIASAAAAAVLDEVRERGLIAHAASMGARLRERLTLMASRTPLIGDIRGRGLLLGVELVRDPEDLRMFGADLDPADVVVRHGARNGLLVYSRRQNAGLFGDWIVIAPPLVITQAECDELADRLERTFADAAAELLA